MGSATKYDYPTMEAEFVAGDMTIRALAIRHGVSPNNVSSVHDQARKRGWVEKREEFRAKATNRALERSVDVAATRIIRRLQVQDHAIEVIDEGLTKMSDDMKRTHKVERGGVLYDEPVMIIRPADMVLLFDRLQAALGSPSQISEERSFGIGVTGEADGQTLRDLAAALRSVPAGPAAAGGAGSSPLPSAPSPRH